jgi:hypothetical protein
MKRDQLLARDSEWNAPSIRLHEFLTGVVPTGGSALLGPDAGLASWPFYGAISFEPIPSSVVDLDGLVAFMAEEDAEHVVVAPGTVAARPSVFAGLLTDTGGTLRVESVPPGWALVYADPPSEPDVVVLRGPPL